MTDNNVELFCANHPTVSTSLRCNRCEKPICTKCAVLTPTGYRCKECVRGQQKVFETAVPLDYLVIFLVVVILSFLGSLLAYRLGFFIIFLAPLYGGIIAEAARASVRRRRSRNLFLVAAAAAILGVIPVLVMLLTGAPRFMNVVWEFVYLLLMTSTLYYRLSGIRIG
jgi:small-conductance mechanosensitive channel